MKTVLVSDYAHPNLIDGLEKMGYSVEYNRDFIPSQLESILPDLSGIVINSKMVMTKARIEMAGKLEFIARLGSGLDIIDLDAAEDKNIKVINTPEGNCDAVAEHVIGMLLCLSNNLIQADKEVREKEWSREKNRGFEIGGKTIGLIGMGNTGRAMARKLSSWGLEIIYNDPYVFELPEEYSYLKAVGLDELIEQADIISLHVQLNEETHHMVNEDFLSKAKKTSILLNSSRGAVVETEALINALEKGLISGACLDVFENEKPHSFTPHEDRLYNKLYEMNNVILSPHIAGWTKESLLKISKVMLDKLDEGLRGIV
jgi:D-3-phosphoglycerate dehydrogenase